MTPKDLRALVERLRAKLSRDRRLPLPVVALKGVRYLSGLAAAPLYLWAVDERGEGIRTLGKPRIENLGFMSIGAGTTLRSVNVPVELATGVGATLRIGREVSINYGASIGAMGSIRLGDRVRVGPYAMIIDTEFHDLHDRSRMPEPRAVTIEDDAWIGAKASVLPGVTIGRGSVVATAAVVNADVPPFTVVAGVPAKPIKQLDPARFVVRSSREQHH